MVEAAAAAAAAGVVDAIEVADVDKGAFGSTNDDSWCKMGGKVMLGRMLLGWNFSKS